MTYEEMVAMPLHTRAIIEISNARGLHELEKTITRVPGGWLYGDRYGTDKVPPVFVPELPVPEKQKVKQESESINLTENL